MAALGAVIADGDDHRDVFKMVGRPDWQSFYPAFDELYGGFQASDLYPDAVSTIEALKRAGYSDRDLCQSARTTNRGAARPGHPA